MRIETPDQAQLAKTMQREIENRAEISKQEIARELTTALSLGREPWGTWRRIPTRSPTSRGGCGARRSTSTAPPWISSATARRSSASAWR